jgi:Transposase IS66 family
MCLSEKAQADNNIAENAMRAIAVGRKNHLFCGSKYRRRPCRFHLYTREDGKAQRRKPRGVPQGYPDRNC